MGNRYFWDEELTEEKAAELTKRIAHEITKRRLEVPAILALELHKPVANINAHFAMMACGFLAPILGAELFDDLTRLLAKRDNIERLVDEIELQAHERQGKSPAEETKA